MCSRSINVRPPVRHGPVAAATGCVLFLAGATIEIGPLLIAMLWVFYVWLDGTHHPGERIGRMRSVGVATGAYAVLTACYWLAIFIVSAGRVANYNAAPSLMVEVLQRRLDPNEVGHVTVRRGPKDSVEFLIPRLGDHERNVQTVKDLVARTGSLEFQHRPRLYFHFQPDQG